MIFRHYSRSPVIPSTVGLAYSSDSYDIARGPERRVHENLFADTVTYELG